MGSDRASRRSLFVLAVVAAAFAVVPGASSAPAAPPAGWWKGTVVVTARWDMTLTAQEGIRGTATLKMTRTTETTADFEFEFAEEQWWLDVPANGACRGQVRSTATASWRGRSDIQEDVSESAEGVSFSYQVETSPETTGRYRSDCSLEFEEPAPEGGRQLSFFFKSGQPDLSTAHRGSGPAQTTFSMGYPPRPGGVNTTTATWDLRLVAAPPGPPQRITYEQSSIRPFTVRRGSTVKLELTDTRLVDAKETALALSGAAGCDLTYLARSRGARPTKVRVVGSWSAGRLRCTWRVPRRGVLARAIATKNVRLSIAPWVLRGRARYWARLSGDHTIFIVPLSRH